jgi:outer membrane protein assembly factor BamB
MLNPLKQHESVDGPTGIRWWPAIVVLALTTAAVTWVQARSDWPFQKRNLTSLPVVLIAAALLLVWWTFFSRAPRAWRFGIALGLVFCLGAGAALFRIRGVSGDLVPILEFRWAKPAVSASPVSPTPADTLGTSRLLIPDTNSFPQFYGPNRDGVLSGPSLETNWTAHPPTEIWRRKVGAAWSGFVIVGDLCLTQEQRGESECVVAYDLATGRERWIHSDPARYHTTIAGEGPRATPAVVSNRVFAAGSTGILNALELDSGRLIWSRNVVTESGGKLPEWGFTSSPLVVDDRVIVHGGEGAGKLLFAFDAGDGKPAWSAGTANPSYASPTLATLADTRQVLAFTRRVVSGHDPATGSTFWELPYESGNVVCATPVVIDAHRVLFSSGYGRGSDLIELTRDVSGGLAARRVWKTIRMKSKFAHLYARDDYLFGLDDGMFACVDLKDGSQRWKEGRYSHGQGLLVGDLYLLMAEAGQLVLLRPTPDGPNEQARFPVFSDKTWNPIALAGDLLLVRNDQEAVCLRLKLAP